MKKHPADTFTIAEIFSAYKDLMAKEAKIQRIKFGTSYRNYLVGASGLCSNGSALKIFNGANLKPKKKGYKACAELIVCIEAFDEGYFLPLALSVSGIPERNKITGQTPRTLLPCDRCLHTLESLFHAPHDLLIHTFWPDEGGPEELHTLGDLLKLHRHNS